MDDCIQRGYSAMAEVLGTGKSFCVKIFKTRNLFFNGMAKYQAFIEELNRLIQERLDLGNQISADSGSSNPPADKKKRTE